MVRLRLERAYNVRDLGGYGAVDDKTTKFNKFLRADSISSLSEKDINTLKAYGITTVIDLRSEEETMAKVNSFRDDEIVHYYNIPLMTGVTDRDWLDNINSEDFMGILYTMMLDKCGGHIGEVFKIISQNMAGCTLFHCTAGKDRTGVIAALLLNLVQVDLYDIIANYQVTNTYIRPNLHNIIQISPEVPISVTYSNPESIERMLMHLANDYGSARNYLIQQGVEEAEIKLIINHFVE